MSERYGVIEVKVHLYLELDCDENQIDEIVQEMDYDFSHPLIQETKIVDHNV